MAGNPESPELRLRRWRDPKVVALALVAMAAGFGQFGVVAALGDVAKTYGSVKHGATLADQAGLSGTTLGLGLSIIRISSLASLFLASMADRLGRRRTLVGLCAVGLALTVASAASPGYWWFVAIFALGRPLLSAANAVAGVSAAEETGFSDRAKAVSLIAAGYGLGAGLLAFIHGLAGGLGFRGLVGLAVIPLALLPLLARRIEEPDRFARYAVTGEHQLPVLAAVGRPFRRRLALISIVIFGLSVITGPANSFVFLYAENVVHMSGTLTSVMVATAGLTGLAGLLLGRYLADHFGRRPTIVLGVASIAVLGVVTYSGRTAAVFSGYDFGVMAASILAPAVGSYVNELFPTAIRASVAGYEIAVGVIGAVVGLLAFGSIADVGNRFGIGAAATFLPAVLATAALWYLPETRGHEPEEFWHDAAAEAG